MKTAKAKPIGRNGTTALGAEDSLTEARISFDRTGQITKINPAGALLLDRSPLALLGRPLARFIARHDNEDFLHHLLRCRMKEKKVETVLHIRSGNGEKIPICLSSICIASDALGVRFRYQTTIVDLRELEAD